MMVGGVVNLENVSVLAEETKKDTSVSVQYSRSKMRDLTDWQMVPAGGGGDWKTTIGRVQSNAKDIEELEKQGNPLLPQPEHLFGNLWGARSWLYKHGINLNMGNTNEFAGNVTGGRRRGSANAGQVDANLDVDWATVVGSNWLTDGLVSHMTVVGRYGNNIGKIIGENITQVQEIYGAGGNVVAKLVNLYSDKYFMNGKIVASFGRLNTGAHFATSPINCNFMNNGMCGNAKPLSGQVGGFNAWPDSTWGTTVLFRPWRHSYARIGAYQVSRAAYGNAAGHAGGWSSIVRTGEDTGGEFPIEVGYEPHWGKNDLVGHYKAGFAYDTSAYPVWGKDIYGGHIATSGQPQKWKRGRDAEWLLLDQMIYRNGPGDLNGLIGYVGYVHTNGDTFQRNNQVIASLLNTGFWKARPMDAVGVVFIHQEMSNKMRDAQNYVLSQGAYVPMGAFPGGASGVQTAETTFELTYIIHVCQGVRFQPDFQYEIHPNAQKNIDDAAFLGFKSRVDF